MNINLVSPGVSIREVDLTINRVDATTQIVGAIAGPFPKGPVNEPTLITSESELIEIFGKPVDKDNQNEYWLSASEYLTYGGSLRVIRTSSNDTSKLVNSNATGIGTTSFSENLKINSKTEYEFEDYSSDQWIFASRNPGSWANDLQVSVIDNKADQIITGIGPERASITQIEQQVSPEVTISSVSVGISTSIISGITTSGIQVNMFVNQIENVLPQNTRIIGIGSESITLETPTINSSVSGDVSLIIGNLIDVSVQVPINVSVGVAVTQSINGQFILTDDGSRTITNGYLRGVITESEGQSISVKVVDIIEGEEVYPIDYQNPGNSGDYTNPYSFRLNSNLSIGSTTITPANDSNISISDWYDNQYIPLNNNNKISWSSIAQKPKTSQYSLERNGKNDELHIVVVDVSGNYSGRPGEILERHLFMSKSIDGKSVISSTPTYYKDLILSNSKLIFSSGINHIGLEEVDLKPEISVDTFGDNWGTEARNISFKCTGSKNYVLRGGKDYSGTNNIGGYEVSNSEIINSYKILENETSSRIDFIICGPSGGPNLIDAQAKADALIAIADKRKDCIVSISPFKSDIVGYNVFRDSNQQTQNILNFFSILRSSSYAVFNSGYKYTLDRFNNKFIYVSCSSDIAGIIARTAVNNDPWLSPAGNSRGTVNNVVKLAYNPTPTQRDSLYKNRINPVLFTPGQGTILFGDKTALSYASAFDRINVRMLFLTIEKVIETAARAQLFEFNDIISRNNFINIVEPYLRDISAKRGITDFLVVCDESNNPPEIIDSYQFIADIYIQPARTTNFIGLTFVATRTGISFSEVVGTV